MKPIGQNSRKKSTPVAAGLPTPVPAIFTLPLTACLNNTSAGILVTSETHQCSWINGVFEKKITTPSPVGLSLAALIRYFIPLISEPQAFEKKMKTLTRDKKPYFGWQLPFTNGQIWEISYLPVFDGPQFKGSIWQIIDITRKHNVQAAIRRNEEKFRVILNNLNAAMCETDVAGNITRVYESFCRLSGYEEKELIGKNITEVFVPEENRDFASNLRKHRINDNVPLVYDMEVVLKDGTRRWVMASSANIFDHSGNIIGGAGIHMDITHQKKLQQELEEARRQAEEARHAQKDFLASMSHEIRTPLNAIIGMAHLLDETNLDAQQKEYVSILKHSSGILLGIVSDILDISRIEAGEFQVNQREFNLRELIQSLRHTFELKLGRRPIKITAELEASLNTWLIGDDMLLNQILLNLLGNAEKFTGEGEIAVKASLESWREDKIWIRFRVCDTGIGIKKDKLELIFRNYKQAEGDIREKYGGTGLGLAIAKQLVELQGGTIGVEEAAGFNTCLSFNLPFMDSRKPLSATGGKQSRKFRQHSFEGARVLVVEDNPMNLRYIMSLLEKYRIDYQLATNGPDAVYFLESRQYDLILMDIRIPGMNGLELAQKIRANEAQPNVATPVIATTAVAMESTASMARAAGITDMLTKPYTPDQLLQVFNKYLNEDETELIMEEVQNLSGYEFNNDLDVRYLTALYENNISYAADLFEIFIRTIREEVAKLKVLVERHDWEQMKFQVHKLKPNFAMVGLTWISAKMQILENYLRTHQEYHNNEIASLFNEITVEVTKFYPVVEAEYGKMRAFVNEAGGD
ncbi:PAS domain-containing hybrid sensor histidine kinase/response regulator [Chitinophaga nivalis]|uniref:histidine kinase n=1 Tax=Chitinophaga nivalis TaxID=2991709 RepID=A0ABT3IQ06_9BACT|nr:PAS domain-containing hybrid sensor histidine kinase/response regulator [Chitinophaga nivalis]MCW3464257.1 PAS domain S-box protein [Chitinophaga nivalis]MCW3486052.1 PAS domain S-box protein [Chitinophaga nivalis]